MLRIALVDDDPSHLQLMKSYAERYSMQEHIQLSVKEFHNGLNFVEDYDGSFDVVFLDIEMPHLDGVEAAHRIRAVDQSVGIIFVTNMAQYAIRGYEVNAIDFIVKPVQYYVFTDKLKKAIQFSKINTEKEIVIDTGDAVIKLRASRLTYIEKDKNYLVYHTKEESFRVRGTITDAILDILVGKVNPSGRLSETYPIRYEDTPAFRNFPSTERNAEYREGIYVGYRYYDTSKVRFQYPFGFGLSYTTFEYGDLEVSDMGISFRITNTGSCDGAEVAQMYVGFPDGKVFRPEKELKGFKKIFLRSGESRKVEICFDDKTFRYWNVETNRWENEAGVYQIMVGSSVADIRLTGSIEVYGTTRKYPYEKEKMPSYYSGLIQQVGDVEFEYLLGHPVPNGKWIGELGMNDAICQMYYAKSALARMIYNRLTAMKRKSEAAGKPDLNILFIYNMPFRGIAKMTGGMVSMEMAEGMLQVVNGHFFAGMGRIIGGFFKNQRENKKYMAKLAKGEKK